MSEFDRALLDSVDDMLRKRYSDRLARFGDDPRALGWDTAENQRRRFAVALDTLDFAGRSVTDIGCGLADFRTFLETRSAGAGYLGIDINPDLIARCRVRHPDARFRQGNILTDRIEDADSDIVVMFGVLNIRFREFDNRAFARAMIAAAFGLCRQALVVDMLTERRDEAYPREDFVHYYDPRDMLGYALELTPHVTLRHDYASIPQRELMLVLRRTPCGS